MDKLQFSGLPESIRFVILGSFNPGEPDMQSLSESHADELRQLYSTPKYQRFSQVRNFYDRPPNRFWGVMDRIHSPILYEKNGHGFKNPDGLKHFKGGDRLAVLDRQLDFCRTQGIFISDIVTAVSTTDFRGIYNNFSDTLVSKYSKEFNTDYLLDVLGANKTARLLLNVRESSSTPMINQHLARLRAAASGRCKEMPSTSGAAGRLYKDLVPEWKDALSLPAQFS